MLSTGQGGVWVVSRIPTPLNPTVTELSLGSLDTILKLSVNVPVEVGLNLTPTLKDDPGARVVVVGVLTKLNGTSKRLKSIPVNVPEPVLLTLTVSVLLFPIATLPKSSQSGVTAISGVPVVGVSGVVVVIANTLAVKGTVTDVSQVPVVAVPSRNGIIRLPVKVVLVVTVDGAVKRTGMETGLPGRTTVPVVSFPTMLKRAVGVVDAVHRVDVLAALTVIVISFVVPAATSPKLPDPVAGGFTCATAPVMVITSIAIITANGAAIANKVFLFVMFCLLSAYLSECLPRAC